jgi:hypothetical protein
MLAFTGAIVSPNNPGRSFPTSRTTLVAFLTTLYCCNCIKIEGVALSDQPA